jgi:hypothetical protein
VEGLAVDAITQGASALWVADGFADALYTFSAESPRRW